MSNKKNKSEQQSNPAADQALIDERVNAVAEKFGAEDVEIVDGDTSESESIIILKNSEGEEFQRGTLSELEERDADAPVEPVAQGVDGQVGEDQADTIPSDSTDTEQVVQEQTLADLKTKYGAESVELQEGPGKEAIIILKNADGQIIDQGIASELLNKQIGVEGVTDEDGKPRALSLDEVHEKGIGTAIPGANPTAAEPKVVDVNDLPKAHSAE